MDIRLISDNELKLRAVIRGPTSAEADVLRNLHAKRSQDRQVFAWEAGSSTSLGPLRMLKPRWRCSSWLKW